MFLKLKHLECFIGELETEQPSLVKQDWSCPPSPRGMEKGWGPAQHMCVSQLVQSREVGGNGKLLQSWVDAEAGWGWSRKAMKAIGNHCWLSSRGVSWQ